MGVSVAAMVGVVVISQPPRLETRFGPLVEDASRRVLLDPEDIEARYAFAEALYVRRAYGETVHACDALIAQAPTDARFWALRGRAQLGRGAHRDAIEDLEHALATSTTPAAWETYAALGNAYAALSSWQAAQESYAAARVVGPPVVALELASADAYEATGDWVRATERLEAALTLAPDAPEAPQWRQRLRTMASASGMIPRHVPGVDPTDVPLTRWSNILAIDVVFDDDTDARLVFDTGASFTTITSEVASELGYTVDQDRPTMHAMTAAGPVTLPMVTVDRVEVGGFVVYDLDVGICDACGMGGLDGLLGLNFTSRFVTTLDAQGATVRIARRPTLVSDPGWLVDLR